MPLKKFSSYSTRIKSEDGEQKTVDMEQQQRRKGKVKPTYAIIAIIALLTIGNIVYQSTEDLQVMNGLRDSEIVSCLMDFCGKDCSPITPNAQCKKMLLCIKRASLTFEEILMELVEEAEENYLAPTIISSIILLYQITENGKVLDNRNRVA